MIYFPNSVIVSFCIIMCLYRRNFKHLCTKHLLGLCNGYLINDNVLKRNTCVLVMY